MKRMGGVCVGLICSVGMGHPLPVTGPSPSQRIVFLGDSITDGETYLLFVEEALTQAGRIPPILVNAGVGGDDAAGMAARLQRDVLCKNPSQVFLSCGVNDKVSDQQFERSVASIAEVMKARRISLTLMTPSIPGGNQPEIESRRSGYIEDLKKVAKEFHLPIADVNSLMKEARSRGESLIGEDLVHPNFEGCRVMARAVLDALGYSITPVPSLLAPTLCRGVIKNWQFRSWPTQSDNRSIRDVSPDAAWKWITLPQPVSVKEWWTEPNGAWWQEQERFRGFALNLDKLIGPATHFEGVAFVSEKMPHNVTFNTGAGLKTIWLNGTQIYRRSGWTGWHAGKEQVAANLQAGQNKIVIETDSNFFLSLNNP